MSNNKGAYNPNAYLQKIKNMQNGLESRTKILNLLEQQPFNAPTIAKNVESSYDAVVYHLRLLEDEAVVSRRGKRPRIWVLTGLGQKRLVP